MLWKGRRSLSDENLALLVISARAASDHAFLLMVLLVFTGQRLRDLLNLERSDIDLERGLLNLSRRARHSCVRRSLPISSTTVQVLRTVQTFNSSRHGRIFCSAEETKNFWAVTRRSIDKQIVARTGARLEWSTSALRRKAAEDHHFLGTTGEILYCILGLRDPEICRRVAPIGHEKVRLQVEVRSSHLLEKVLVGREFDNMRLQITSDLLSGSIELSAR